MLVKSTYCVCAVCRVGATKLLGTNQENLFISRYPCQNILDEKYEDVLVNVNIMDTERTKKNFENLKSHAGYNAYDQEQVDENTGK